MIKDGYCKLTLEDLRKRGFVMEDEIKHYLARRERIEQKIRFVKLILNGIFFACALGVGFAIGVLTNAFYLR